MIMALILPDAISKYKGGFFISEIISVMEYPGYKVDRDGNVYGKKGRKLKPSVNHKGYKIVNLMVNGKRVGVAVHTLIATAFIPNPTNKPQVNHIDGHKENNRVENLEWVTRKENMYHAMHVLGFVPAQSLMKPVCAVPTSSGKDVISFTSIRDAGVWINQKYHVNSGCSEVWRVANGRRKSARGYNWKYIS